MFEPWPAPAPVALEDEPYEKSRVSLHPLILTRQLALCQFQLLAESKDIARMICPSGRAACAGRPARSFSRFQRAIDAANKFPASHRAAIMPEQRGGKPRRYEATR